MSGLTDISNTEDIEALAASNILDVLSRNYWYDSSIVPIHILTTNPTKNGFQSSTREV